VRMLALGVMLVFGLLIVMALNLRIARTESALGMLVPSTGSIRLTASLDGVISQINVALGDRVDAGQALLRIDATRNDMNGAASDAAMAAELERDLKLLDTELQHLEQQQVIDQTDREAALESALRFAAGAQRQQELQEERQRLAAEKVERLRGIVEKGVVSK